jgi:leucyl/phenylalanyl-tRNA--protein transferase
VDIRFVTRHLTPEMVLENYARGMFPMANPGVGVITWHCPKPRAVIPLEGFHVSRSLERTLRLGRFTVTYNGAFAEVIAGCADRGGDESTWISDEIREVYTELHRRGHAHSVEVWVDGVLAGGTYGLQLGGAFFAESKFHRVRDMSKVALAQLVYRLREREFALLEVQYVTPHLRQFGAVEVPHRAYIDRLEAALSLARRFD